MPNPKIEYLVRDIYSLFETGADLDDARLDEFLNSLRGLLKARFASYAQPEERRTLRMSNIGKDPLQLWYDVHGTHIPEPLTGQDRFKFLYGDIIEELVIFLAQQSGHEVTDKQKGVELDEVRGSIDCKIDGEVVDVKSVSGNSAFKFLSEESLRNNDSFGYIAQLSGYCQALGRDKGYFIAVNKDSGEIRLCETKAEDVTERIASLKRILAEPYPPYHCGNQVPDGKSGNLRLGSPCTYCRHKHECWKDANQGEGLKAYQYSNGIKYLTQVAKEPRVDQLPYKKRETND